MRPEDLHEFTRRRPFAPFRIHTTDGRSYEVRHPDEAIVLRSRVVVGVGGDDGVPDHLEQISLIHIVRIEESESEASRASGSP